MGTHNMAIDKTKRPLRVPPQFQLYAEEHGLFDLYHRMLQRLVIVKPEDPLQWMIDWLQRESDFVPKVAVIGAPGSGKGTIARKLAAQNGAVLVEASSLASNDENNFRIKRQTNHSGLRTIKKRFRTKQHTKL